MAEFGQGVVEVVRTNNAGYYALKIGNDWYGAGKSHPGVDKGDYIEFAITRNGKYMNIAQGSIQKKEAQVQRAPSVAGAARNAGVTRDDYWAEKAKKDEFVQAAINWQSARNSAIAAVGSMVEHGAVKLPSAQAKKYDVFMALIDEVTVRYFEDTKYVTENMEPPMGNPAPADDDNEEEEAPF